MTRELNWITDGTDDFLEFVGDTGNRYLPIIGPAEVLLALIARATGIRPEAPEHALGEPPGVVQLLHNSSSGNFRPVLSIIEGGANDYPEALINRISAILGRDAVAGFSFHQTSQ
jgi:hypothetical protein